MPTVGNLVVNLSANSRNFNRGLSSAQTRLQQFSAFARRGLAVAAGAGFAAVGVAVAGVTRQMSKLDAVAKTASRTGFGTEVVGSLGLAAELAGSDVAAVQRGLADFNRRMGEAKTGTGQALRTINQLGLSMETLGALSPDEQLLAVSDAIAQLPTQAEKANAAYQLFGRTGKDLVNVLGQGSDAFKAFQAEAAARGQVFSASELKRVEDANDAITRIQAGIGGIFNKLAVAAAPMVERVASGIDGIIVKFHEWTGAIGRAWQTVSGFYTDIRDRLELVGAVVGVIAAEFPNIWAGAFGTLVSHAEAAYQWLQRASVEIATRVMDVWSKASKAIGQAMQKALTGDFASAEAILARTTRNITTKLANMRLPEFESPELDVRLANVGENLAAAIEDVERKQAARRRAGGAAGNAGMIAELMGDVAMAAGKKAADANIAGVGAVGIKAEPRLAGAAERGSAEAMRQILAASGRQSPEVKAIEKQTKDLGKEFKNAVGELVGDGGKFLIQAGQ